MALAGLIDYAGLFPPASLDMGDAIAGYRRARSGSESWIVDRFICPASRLHELGELDEGRVSALITADLSDPVALQDDLVAVKDFISSAAVPVAAVEARMPDDPAAGVRAISELAAVVTPVFAEIPHDAVYRGLAALASCGPGVGAKLRCGGTNAAAFPSATTVAAFIHEAVRLRVPFKATAGLHHPVRHFDPDIRGHRHGFVNLLTAAAVAGAGGAPADVESAVAETDPGTFRMNADGLYWGSEEFDADAIAAARRVFAAYGSCDFDEPVVDLREHGWLPQVGASW